MISVDAKHEAIHYPAARHFRIRIRPSVLIGTGTAILAVIAAAWLEFALAGIMQAD